MKTKCMSKNNKGASLVLVIVAMLFVGIIASVILTVTVGNSNSVRTSQDTSKNFYSAESVLDDFKLFLQKFANSSATSAYGAVLEHVAATGTGDKETLAKLYKRKFIESMNSELSSFPELTSTLINGSITFGRCDITNVDISFAHYVAGYYDTLKPENSTFPKLEGVVITFKDENGYESKITTDITFSSQMPPFGWTNPKGDFSYDVDHFAIISRNNISANSSYLTGTIKGNIYAGNNLEVETDPATSSDQLQLQSEYIIVGNNIDVVNGKLSLQKLNDSSLIDSSVSEMWCNEIVVGSAEVSTNNMNLYLSDDLTLNGKKSKFVSDGGYYYGYGADSRTRVEAVTSDSGEKSSAIVLNGLSSTLDISKLSGLYIAGTAYTQLPGIDGADNVAGNYDANNVYFTQGESITYRALQPLYLIPGQYIKKVNHNPMTATEAGFNETTKTSTIEIDIAEAKTKVPNIENYLGSPAYKIQTVRYVNSGTNYVYVFWNFKDVDSAVAYFSDVVDNKTGQSALIEKQISMLDYGANNGYISLPSAQKIIGMKGNGIKYVKANSEATKGSFAKEPKKSVSGESTLPDFASDKNGLYYSLDKSKGIGQGDLFENLFLMTDKGATVGMGVANVSSVADCGVEYEVKGPYSTQFEADGVTIKTQYVESSSKKYKLVIGDNIKYTSTFDSDTAYIFISPGNVSIETTTTDSAPLNGMIIAGGEVTLPYGFDMTCLGMITRTPSGGTAETISEFKALLNTVINGDKTVFADNKTPNGNTILRRIFNVADTDGSTGDTTDGNLVKLVLSNWKRN